MRFAPLTDVPSSSKEAAEMAEESRLRFHRHSPRTTRMRRRSRMEHHGSENFARCLVYAFPPFLFISFVSFFSSYFYVVWKVSASPVERN